jgi:hypothetical protein
MIEESSEPCEVCGQPVREPFPVVFGKPRAIHFWCWRFQQRHKRMLKDENR